MTANAARLLPWLAELVSASPGLLRTFEQSADHEVLLRDAARDHARASADAGRPAPTDELAMVLPPDAVREVRATVAHAELSRLVRTSLLTRVAYAPVACPLLTATGLVRSLARLAPPMPVVELRDEDEANLLAHVLASAAPTYLANAALRVVLAGLPRPIAVGIRSGRSAATVRFERRRVVVENGISRGAMVVVEGEAEALLEHASGSIVRELGGLRVRPR